METVEIQIFDIHELPENVRGNVIYNWRAGDDWYWWNEWENV